tara:strand:+ start:33369 stop:35915 length:2547 start_codon:yes stop_codon:yes gene_type:complete
MITDRGGVIPSGSIITQLKSVANDFSENWAQVRGSHDLPLMAIDIKYKPYLKLMAKRAEALKKGCLISADDDFVSASIRLGTRTVPVKMRLKGDYMDHLTGRKWSFRVKVKNGDDILGLRVFSLQHPRTRGFQRDALFMDELRRNNVLAVRHKYVKISVNGEDLGIMDLEEHFSKELLESQRRREGVILATDDRVFWDWYQTTKGWLTAERLYPILRPFRSSHIQTSPVLQSMDEVARGLYRGFIAGDVKPHEAFDPKSWGRYIALAELWQRTHGLIWFNVRLYFNPIMGKFEPVAYDSIGMTGETNYLVKSLARFLPRTLLKDPIIRREFVISLDEICKEAQTPEFQARIRAADLGYRGVLASEFMFVPACDTAELSQRAVRLSFVTESNYDTLQLGSPLVRTSRRFAEPVRALVGLKGETVSLDIANQCYWPVTINRVMMSTPDTKPDSAPAPVEIWKGKLVLAASELNAIPSLTRLLIPGIEPPAGTTFLLEGNESAQQQEFSCPAYSYPSARASAVIEPSTIAQTLASNPFLSFDRESDAIVVAKGQHLIDQSISVPAGLGFRVPAGTTLRFEPKCQIIVRGACVFGEPDGEEVVLTAASAEGHWQGIFVQASKAKCEWHNVTTRNTSGVRVAGLSLTGGVTFYQANLRMSQSRFETSTAEDALNLIECEFDLTDTVIQNTSSDALDSDFSKGTYSGGGLLHVGGDGLDFSGSDVAIEGTQFRNVGDKAISAGEGSEVRVRNVEISESGTGIASKDGSFVDVADSVITNISHIAVMTYVKKREFGPGKATCTKLTLRGCKRNFISQTGSSLTVDGDPVAEEDIDIDELYAKGYMQKNQAKTSPK